MPLCDEWKRAPLVSAITSTNGHCVLYSTKSTTVVKAAEMETMLLNLDVLTSPFFCKKKPDNHEILVCHKSNVSEAACRNQSCWSSTGDGAVIILWASLVVAKLLTQAEQCISVYVYSLTFTEGSELRPRNVNTVLFSFDSKKSS